MGRAPMLVLVSACGAVAAPAVVTTTVEDKLTRVESKPATLGREARRLQRQLDNGAAEVFLPRDPSCSNKRGNDYCAGHVLECETSAKTYRQCESECFACGTNDARKEARDTKCECDIYTDGADDRDNFVCRKFQDTGAGRESTCRPLSSGDQDVCPPSYHVCPGPPSPPPPPPYPPNRCTYWIASAGYKGLDVNSDMMARVAGDNWCNAHCSGQDPDSWPDVCNPLSWCQCIDPILMPTHEISDCDGYFLNRLYYRVNFDSQAKPYDSRAWFPSMLGDGICDDGQLFDRRKLQDQRKLQESDGDNHFANLNCPEFNYDEGDCVDDTP